MAPRSARIARKCHACARPHVCVAGKARAAIHYSCGSVLFRVKQARRGADTRTRSTVHRRVHCDAGRHCGRPSLHPWVNKGKPEVERRVKGPAERPTRRKRAASSQTPPPWAGTQRHGVEKKTAAPGEFSRVNRDNGGKQRRDNAHFILRARAGVVYSYSSNAGAPRSRQRQGSRGGRRRKTRSAATFQRYELLSDGETALQKTTKEGKEKKNAKRCCSTRVKRVGVAATTATGSFACRE